MSLLLLECLHLKPHALDQKLPCHLSELSQSQLVVGCLHTGDMLHMCGTDSQQDQVHVICG